MWEMFDDMIECDECGSVLEPPPKFTIPPPPRPPFLGEYGLSNCNEEEMALKAQQAWDGDICEAMPILDASLYSSQSLQTSAIIAVFTLLLILVVLISSLFIWKNKRKMQNFLPCKTPTRGPHINGTVPLGGNHALTYEDPDVHLGHHRPLVMRHHHNVEMLHGKSIHFPSGYPMTRSPPFLVSSSPGPDPYRSNDNVYEELGPSRDSDGDSEPPLHSDDDFAEDELSLPGERFFNKQTDTATPAMTSNISTIYHERIPAVSIAIASSSTAISGPERNSVLSTSSGSTQEASTVTAVSLTSCQNNNQNTNLICSGSAPTHCVSRNLFSGIHRNSNARNKFNTASGRPHCRNEDRLNGASVDEFNTSSSTTDANEIGPLQQMYDNRSNLMSLAFIPQRHQQQRQIATSKSPSYHSLNQSKNCNKTRSGHCNARSTSVQFYNTLENEVERRNRMNEQLNNAPPVATIYRERINYPGSGRFNPPQPYYTSNSNHGLLANSIRARTVSRSMDRRYRVNANTNPIDTNYGYAEPIYHDNYHYDICGSPSTLDDRLGEHTVPAYATGQAMLNYGTEGVYQDNRSHNLHHLVGMPTYQGNAQLYSRGDSSFGSDSGYSHHTPASSIGRHDYDMAQSIQQPQAKAGNKESTTNKISAALTFNWNRRKSTPVLNDPNSLNIESAKCNHLYNNSTEATSPNNNSASSVITTTLENTSSASSASASGCSSASAQNNNILVAPTQSQTQT